MTTPDAQSVHRLARAAYTELNNSISAVLRLGEFVALKADHTDLSLSPEAYAELVDDLDFDPKLIAQVRNHAARVARLTKDSAEEVLA